MSAQRDLLDVGLQPRTSQRAFASLGRVVKHNVFDLVEALERRGGAQSWRVCRAPPRLVQGWCKANGQTRGHPELSNGWLQ
eukprot:3066260-Amphidinium_carterae.3